MRGLDVQVCTYNQTQRYWQHLENCIFSALLVELGILREFALMMIVVLVAMPA